MSFTETSKLIEQSRKIVQDSDSNDVSVMFTSILSLVSTIDNRLQRVEKGLSQFDGLKNVLRSLTSGLVTVEKDVKTCSAKVTELEGVSKLFDNLKVKCKKNKDQITKVSKICDKNLNDIKRVSTKLESVQANISTNSCSCEEDIESLKSTVLDLQCRSMKNNLIFTGLHEVSNEYTEDLLRDFLHSELGIDYKIEFGNVHRFGR
jgi:DNA repair ATPase RecN